MHTGRERYASAGVIIDQGGNILLVRKRIHPQKGLSEKWMFPGGDWRKYENAREALQKILLHDFGLTITITGSIGMHAHERRTRERGGEFIATTWFSATVKGVRPPLTPRAKWDATKWVSPRELFHTLSDTVRREWLSKETRRFLHLHEEEREERLPE